MQGGYGDTISEPSDIRSLRPWARALRDIVGTNPGELPFRAGDIIDIELRNTSDDWRGLIGSHVGTFRLDSSVVCASFQN